MHDDPAHTHASTPHGPDYCVECSEAAQQWVAWPCKAALTDPQTTTEVERFRDFLEARGAGRDLV